VSNHKNTFDWLTFPEGRARFSGERRGWDEIGHETFAVDLHGNEYFGEIKRSYLKNENDYNIVIDYFGYGRGEDVGMHGNDVREIFSPEDEVMSRALIASLIEAGLDFERPPFPLIQTEVSHYMGQLTFQDGWILVRSHHAGAAQ
jgi:hypothetical protein